MRENFSLVELIEKIKNMGSEHIIAFKKTELVNIALNGKDYFEDMKFCKNCGYPEQDNKK